MILVYLSHKTRKKTSLMEKTTKNLNFSQISNDSQHVKRIFDMIV